MCTYAKCFVDLKTIFSKSFKFFSPFQHQLTHLRTPASFASLYLHYLPNFSNFLLSGISPSFPSEISPSFPLSLFSNFPTFTFHQLFPLSLFSKCFPLSLFSNYFPLSLLSNCFPALSFVCTLHEPGFSPLSSSFGCSCCCCLCLCLPNCSRRR